MLSLVSGGGNYHGQSFSCRNSHLRSRRGRLLGRLHRGWAPAEMDEVLGRDFFQCSARGEDLLPEYPAKVRALEPVRRRRYVEVGLHGHSIQLALITRNVLMSEEETPLDVVLNEAMNEEIFREPLNELLDVMYRLCRASEPIRPEASLCFFSESLGCGDFRADSPSGAEPNSLLGSAL